MVSPKVSPKVAEKVSAIVSPCVMANVSEQVAGILSGIVTAKVAKMRAVKMASNDSRSSLSYKSHNREHTLISPISTHNS